MKKETERKRDRNKEILYTRNILRTNSKSPAPHTYAQGAVNTKKMKDNR